MKANIEMQLFCNALWTVRADETVLTVGTLKWWENDNGVLLLIDSKSVVVHKTLA